MFSSPEKQSRPDDAPRSRLASNLDPGIAMLGIFECAADAGRSRPFAACAAVAGVSGVANGSGSCKRKRGTEMRRNLMKTLDSGAEAASRQRRRRAPSVAIQRRRRTFDPCASHHGLRAVGAASGSLRCARNDETKRAALPVRLGTERRRNPLRSLDSGAGAAQVGTGRQICSPSRPKEPANWPRS